MAELRAIAVEAPHATPLWSDGGEAVLQVCTSTRCTQASFDHDTAALITSDCDAMCSLSIKWP